MNAGVDSRFSLFRDMFRKVATTLKVKKSSSKVEISNLKADIFRFELEILSQKFA